MTTLLDAALNYARAGWYVFPCEPGGKKPCGQLVPKGHLDATTDEHQIAAWWIHEPHANIGVAVAPSGLVVLDVDTAEGKPGAKSLAEIEDRLDLTRTAWTGRGGLHVVYKRPADVEPRRKIGFKPGLDLLGDGYIVVAPSKLTDGRTYRWNDMRDPVPMPKSLLDVALAQPVPVKVQLDRAAIPGGGRNNALFKLGAALRDTGIGVEALANALHHENQQRCQPPLSDDELKLIIDSVMRRVQPSRDVANGAVVEQEVLAAIKPKSKRTKISEIALEDHAPIRFYVTGFPDLDELIGGGLATQSVFGIIGPPSSGKSAFVGSVIMGLQKQLTVLHVSTELPRRELMVRYAAYQLGFAWRDGIKGRVGKFAMASAVAGLNVELLGCDDLDTVDPLGSIRREAEEMRAANGGVSPAIVVDYVQLLARGNDDKIRARVGELTKQLRILAQQLDTIVVAVFASRRDFYGGGKLEVMRQSDNATVFLAAAKESGDIEFDCATLVYLDVDQLHEGLPKPARIAVARCRYGDVGFAGARAALDVGKWWSDPGAAVEMTKEQRNERKSLDQNSRDVEYMADLIDRMPNQSWRTIRGASRIGTKRSDAAKQALLESGRLTIEREVVYDKNGRRSPRDLLRVIRGSAKVQRPAGNDVPPPDVPSASEDS